MIRGKKVSSMYLKGGLLLESRVDWLYDHRVRVIGDWSTLLMLALMHSSHYSAGENLYVYQLHSVQLVRVNVSAHLHVAQRWTNQPCFVTFVSFIGLYAIKSWMIKSCGLSCYSYWTKKQSVCQFTLSANSLIDGCRVFEFWVVFSEWTGVVYAYICLPDSLWTVGHNYKIPFKGCTQTFLLWKEKWLNLIAYFRPAIDPLTYHNLIENDQLGMTSRWPGAGWINSAAQRNALRNKSIWVFPAEFQM